MFPVEAFQQGFAQALGKPAAAERSLQYSVSEGAIELREWIAGYKKRMGVACTPANILIICGSQQALNAYEPYYGRIDPSANTKIPAPGDGKPAQFAYVVTNFTNPTREMLTLAERKRVLAAAANRECGGD